MNRRGFLAALLAAPIVAKAAPFLAKDAAFEIAPEVAASPTGFAVLTSGDVKLWSAALWKELRDYGHMTCFGAEYEIDRTALIDGVDIHRNGVVIHQKFTVPRQVTVGDQFRVAYQTRVYTQ